MMFHATLFRKPTDIKRNTFGVMKLAGNKPGLESAIDQYFRMRAEDSNGLDTQ